MVWVCSVLTSGLLVVSVFLGVCQAEVCARWAAVYPRETFLGTVYLEELGMETECLRNSPVFLGSAF